MRAFIDENILSSSSLLLGTYPLLRRFFNPSVLLNKLFWTSFIASSGSYSISNPFKQSSNNSNLEDLNKQNRGLSKTL